MYGHKLNRKTLGKTATDKDLVDSKLNFRNQCQAAADKAEKIMRCIKRGI